MKRTAALVVMCVFAVAWGWMAIGGGMQFWSGIQSRSWPSVQGEIISSGSEGPTKSHRYLLVALYRYQVGDHRFESHRVRAIESYGAKEAVEAKILRLPPGKTISVYYDPSNPSIAYLEKGVSFSEGIMPFVGGIVFILLVIVIRSILKSEANQAFQLPRLKRRN